MSFTDIHIYLTKSKIFVEGVHRRRNDFKEGEGEGEGKGAVSRFWKSKMAGQRRPSTGAKQGGV